MDLVDYDEAKYLAPSLTISLSSQTMLGADITVQPIPMSALKGENIAGALGSMAWYDGPALITYLETVSVDDTRHQQRRSGCRYNGSTARIRAFAASRVRSSLARSSPAMRSRRCQVPEKARSRALSLWMATLMPRLAGQSVTLTLTDEIDSSRGDVICSADDPAEVSDQFQARILWMADSAMLPGRRYLMKIGTKTVTATVNAPKHQINVNTLKKRPARTLELNEIGVCTLSLDQPIAFDPYDAIRGMGGFILIDRLSNDTVGLGLIDFALRRASNIHWQALDVDKSAMAEQKGQKPAVLWFTGLSGSGKSTIANALQNRLFAMGRHTYLLDGDNVRHGLNRDLGFTDADRVENIRRVANVAKLMADAGLITLVSFISPFRAERQMARNMMDDGEFFEVHVNTPLEVAEERDVKGLYKKARAGEIKNFTGLDSPYEEPTKPEIRIDTVDMSPEDAADHILVELLKRGIIAS